jgi:hypothetical protein
LGHSAPAKVALNKYSGLTAVVKGAILGDDEIEGLVIMEENLEVSLWRVSSTEEEEEEERMDWRRSEQLS